MHLKYISSTRIFSSRFTKIFLLFCACAFIGSSIGKIVSHNTARQTAASAQSSNWGLSFQEEGKRPVGNATIEELAQYNAFFAEDTEEKKIYLTFDAGFENGNTPAILDALKKHQAPATFFVVGNFISENKDLIKRMETEGHIVGNHTMTHPDMSKISTKESFQKELSDVEKIYREITGKEMTKFYRPPQGIYSTQNLSMARELGYHTFFWSLAYVDWYQDNQPDPQEAIAKLTKRIHPGAIVLLHSTSSTNAQILDELLDKWEEMGYSFHSLNETSVYKGYKQDKIEMRGDRAEMSDFPLYLNTVAGGLDRRDQTIGGFSFVVKIYALPVIEIIG